MASRLRVTQTTNSLVHLGKESKILQVGFHTYNRAPPSSPPPATLCVLSKSVGEDSNPLEHILKVPVKTYKLNIKFVYYRHHIVSKRVKQPIVGTLPSSDFISV